MAKHNKLNPARDESEQKLLTKIGDKLRKDLYDLDKPVEWLSFESETARSTIRDIFNANVNAGVLTLNRLSVALGYKDVSDFLDTI